MADLKISALNSLAGADLVAADVVAVVDDSASETKKLTVSDLIANGVTLISDATIPSAKILFAAGAIDTAELAASAVETAKINDSAVTAAKLADNSSVTLVSTLPASGDFTGQIALDTDDDKIYVWDGSAWDSVKGAGSINVVNGSTSGIINITTSTSGDTVTISTTLDDTSAAANFLAGPTGAGGTVGYRAIAGSDLPKATTSTKGAVVVNGNGLTMSNDEIQIDNSVTAETTNHHVVQYDANGLITGGREITGADIPSATSSVKGSVFPGTGLAVTAAGELNHSNNITAGTFTKVTVDTEGHVTATTDLAASDIPDLPASKITTGTLPAERVANDAITADKLANESTTKFIGAGATDNVVTFPDGDFKGQFAYDEKNEDLYVYTGNSFIPITVISGNLINAGTYNASTNLISSVTTAGSAAGFTSGGSLPTPANTNLNYYVVVDTSGTGSGAAPAVALAPPDMLVSLGTGTTFQLVDVSNAIAGQTAANISVVPVGSIAATDAQAAIQELDTEKLAKAGGTMTGNLELGDGIVIVFEGSTADDYETTLTVTDPTADRTITLPDETGTVVTTGSSGVVTSTMITDGTIVNADISASAEIAVSKLANGTARQLLQTDSTGGDVEFTSNIDVPGTLDCTGAGTFDSSLTVTGVINADGKVKFPAGTAALPSFYNGTDTDTGLYFSAANEISVSTGGTQRVVVDSSGNVGIGTSSANSALNVVSLTGDPAVLVSNGAVTAGAASLGFRTATSPVGTFQSAIISNRTNSPTAGDTTLALQNTKSGILSTSLFIDTSGRLLVGTTSGGSVARLQVQGSTIFNDAFVDICYSGSAASGIASDTNLGVLRFTDQASNANIFAQISCAADAAASSGDYPGRLVFSTTADGASSPTERLRIDSSGDIKVTFPDGNTGLRNKIAFTTESPYQDETAYIAANRTAVSTAPTDLVFATGTASGASEKVRIDSSGNTGIGESSPSYKLHVKAGQVMFQETAAGSNAVLRLKGANTSKGGAIIAQSSSDGSAPLEFYSGTSQTMQIDSSGRLLVGTTSAPGSSIASTALIQVQGRAGFSSDYSVINARAGYTPSSANAALGFLTFCDSSNNIGAWITAYSDGGAWTSGSNHRSRLMFATTANGGTTPTERIRVQADGNVRIGNASTLYPQTDNSISLGVSGNRWSAVWAANGTIQTSDERTKTAVADSTLAIDFVKSLRPVSYKWIEGGKRDTGERDEDNNFIYESVPGQRTHWGFIAQEVKQAADDAGVDFGGWVLTDKNDPDSQQALRYDQFIAPLTKALQEAIAKIETLEAKVAALEAE